MVRKTTSRAEPATTTRRKVVVAATAGIEGAPPQLTGATEVKEVEHCTVVIPKSFMLTLADHQRVTYPQGTQEMPVDHAEHWWAVVNGVKKYEPKK